MPDRGDRMRIVLHDYGGYAFPTQLSRALAARGHEMLHLHASGVSKGAVERRADDPRTFDVDAIDIGEPFRKRGSPKRVLQEFRYGKLLADRIGAFAPNVVISANSSLDIQASASAEAHRQGAAFVFWIQDIHSVAIHRILARRQAIPSGLLATRFTRLERRLLRESDAIVAITDDFVPILEQWGIPTARIWVIENWAPLEEITPFPKSNAWSIEQGLTDTPVFLYAGTLGLKHDPALLVQLAQALPQAQVVVISEGRGADWLIEHGGAAHNLMILPYQPIERVSEVLASADVLVAILEHDAGVFSVPSKVYTYLAAARPILAAIPKENLAARTIESVGAGRVVEPGDVEAFLAAARTLIDDPDARRVAASAGRAYAESAFGINGIADRFETVIYSWGNPHSTSKSVSSRSSVK